MSSSPDWVGMEAAIFQLLPSSGAATSRAQLLARLSDYSTAATREARTLGAIVPDSAECALALEWLLRPVFICGHQRSGTTLLRNLLDGHPQLLSLPSEGTYFTSFDYVARSAPSDRDIDRFAAEWITRFVDPHFEPHFRLGQSDVNRNPAVDFARMLFGWYEALRRRVPQELAPLLALVAAFRAITAPACSPRLWVEKTPQNERHVARFALLDAARFIQLVRDPRAMLASLCEIYRITGSESFDAAEHARAIGQSLRLAQENPPRFWGRYLVVRYEDLVERTMLQVKAVQEFLGITSDATLLVPTIGGRAVCANSSFGRGAAGVIEPSRPPPTLPSKHLALLGVYADAARVFGYEIPAPGIISRSAIRLRHWPRHSFRVARAYLRAARVRYS